MKRVNLFIVIVGLMIITSLLAACDSSAEPALTASEVPRITAEELKKRLDDGQDILVIDTRNGSKLYELGHVPGAIMKPTNFNNVAHEQVIVAYCA